MNDFVLTYYGDDLTGSTDVMEVLEWSGVPTVLFLEPPDAETIRQRFPHARAIGVAGVSRTMSPQEMDELLPANFAALKSLGASYFHYKVCSTFDSSPTVGSIGRATEIALQVFDAQFTPMMVGAPALRRYVAFSNLFARVNEITYRLDRHPTMSKHPTTPMNESDIRLHLGQQTKLSIASMNVLQMAHSSAEVERYFSSLVDDGAQVIVFDTIDDSHLYTIGRLIWSLQGDKPVVLVGSSGFQYALTHFWHTEGIVEKPTVKNSVAPVDQLIVMSGSAAPATAEQIKWAINAGFVPMRLDSASLVDPSTAESTRAAVIAEALEVLATGRNLLLFSAQGSDDPTIASTKNHLERLGLASTNMGSLLGLQQGIILRELLEKTDLRRVVVCGGDTCSYAARQLGIFALQALIPVAPGAPLCRASSDNPALAGLEIALKGGQVGKPNYFESILHGFAT
jgi:3-oxoisoapionate kinase